MLKAGVDVRAYSGPEVYHPKVFLASGGNEPAQAMLGSANLSESALLASVEVGVTIEDDGALSAWFDDIFDNRSAVFDDARLSRLDTAFAKRMKAELNYRGRLASSEPTAPSSSDGWELVDSLFSGLGLYVAPLSFDQAGNNVRNLGHARNVLAMPTWNTKQRSEMKLLGLAEVGQLTPLGRAARGDATDAELARRWTKWLKAASDAELASLSGKATLVQFRRALRRFWTLRPEVCKFFLDRSGVSSQLDLPVLQAIELLANVEADMSEFTLDEIRALAPQLRTLDAFPSNVRQTIGDYMRNKWTRDWGIADRRLLLEAWRDA